MYNKYENREKSKIQSFIALTEIAELNSVYLTIDSKNLSRFFYLGVEFVILGTPPCQYE